jgi:hypothetical protein
METLAFLLLLTMQRKNTGVVSVSKGIFYCGYLVTKRMLHSNDGLQSNTSQYIYIYISGWALALLLGQKNKLARKAEFITQYRYLCHVQNILYSNSVSRLVPIGELRTADFPEKGGMRELTSATAAKCPAKSPRCFVPVAPVL